MITLSSGLTKPKFLLDENVPRKLLQSLTQQGIDAVFKPKGLSDDKLASFTLSEKRVIVTNDRHFADALRFPKESIYGVVWLRISQNDAASLVSSFFTLLAQRSDFKGLLITLHADRFDVEETLSSLTK